MVKYLCFIIFLINLTGSQSFASRYLESKKLWQHVVTVDRLAWQEREGQELINQKSNDLDFVRRIYLDITGKIPTYFQIRNFVESTEVNKRERLIEDLLSSPGYASHFSTFWLDLLRDQHNADRWLSYKEYTRFTERFLAENWPYDEIVKKLILAEGNVNENPAVGYYFRDFETDFNDTFNATTRVFLGTRLGCAQCHNHRFDKWTQKEFFEASAHFYGVNLSADIDRQLLTVARQHFDLMLKDKRYKSIQKNKPLPSIAMRVFFPSRGRVTFGSKNKYTYPEHYAYDNAKPGEEIIPRIVFDYGPKKSDGKTPREKFSNWLTSKENIMFARVMPNRLWKRIMGFANMEPVDDYKDNLEVQNKQLFNTLGDIFVDLNYDFKALLSVIFNSEAYQYAYDPNNNIEIDEYNVQGVKIKRMSAHQIHDSLKTLRYGDLDQFSKNYSDYFELESRISELAMEYTKELVPHFQRMLKINGKNNRKSQKIDSKIINLMIVYLEKYKEIEDYFQILPNGYLKGREPKEILQADRSSSIATSMMNEQKIKNGNSGSMMHASSLTNTNVIRSNKTNTDFMQVFGSLNRSSPESTVDTGATMKQILKMINSDECKAVVKKDSYLMQTLVKINKSSSKINFLYMSLFGRSPTSAEQNIAMSYLENNPTFETWSKYTLALLNSPEFYFIK